jgi:nucleoside-diphosphate-sugar epimerase
MMASPPIPEPDLRAVLEKTRLVWPILRGERIFITGGTGFFGSWLLESFSYANRELELNAQATVLTRDPTKFRAKSPHLAEDPAIKLMQGDVRTFVFPDGEFHYVIHAATEASAMLSTEAPLEMLNTILHGTERTLEFAAQCGAKRFLLTSSGAVYGSQPSDIENLPETYIGAPNALDAASVYAEGKRASELMCALYAKTYGLHCAIARCWAFCGPHLPLDTHFAIGNFIRDVMAGGPVQILGDGTPTRSYLYAADLAVWLWIMLFNAPSMRAYNVGSDQSVSVRELAETVVETLQPGTQIRVNKTPVPYAPISRYVPCTLRAKQELGLGVTIGLQEAIQRTATWYGFPSGRRFTG